MPSLSVLLLLLLSFPALVLGQASTTAVDQQALDDTINIVATSQYTPRELRAVLHTLDDKEKKAAADVLSLYADKKVTEIDGVKVMGEIWRRSPSLHRKVVAVGRLAIAKFEGLQPGTQQYLKNVVQKVMARRSAEGPANTFVPRRDARIAEGVVDDLRSLTPAIKADLVKQFPEPMSLLDSPYAGAAKLLLRRVAANS